MKESKFTEQIQLTWPEETPGAWWCSWWEAQTLTPHCECSAYTATETDKDNLCSIRTDTILLHLIINTGIYSADYKSPNTSSISEKKWMLICVAIIYRRLSLLKASVFTWYIRTTMMGSSASTFRDNDPFGMIVCCRQKNKLKTQTYINCIH